MSAETKTSKGTKIFTFVYVLLLILLLIFASVYVAMTPEFVKPNNNQQETDASVWEYNMDDLFAYFEEHGVMQKEERISMTKIGTENWICNGVDMIWWDVEHLEEGTDEYNYWKEYEANEFAYMMFAGSVYAPVANGPFAIWVSQVGYPGNAEELIALFREFPKGYERAEE